MAQHPDYYPPWTSIAAHRELISRLGDEQSLAFNLLCRYAHEQKRYPTARELEEWAGVKYLRLARRLGELKDKHNLIRWGPARMRENCPAWTWIPEPDPSWKPKDPLRIYVVFETENGPARLLAICSRGDMALQQCTTVNHYICERRLNEPLKDWLDGYFPLREEETPERSAPQEPPVSKPHGGDKGFAPLANE